MSDDADWTPSCPFCGSEDVEEELPFGSALSKSQYSCPDCGSIFERIRWEGQHPSDRSDPGARSGGS